MKLIINFTPTGMIPTREMTPYVPISVNEIIEDVHEAFEIGITMVHLHARDEKTGEPTYRAEVYQRIIEGIRKFSRDLVICVSLSGRTFNEFEKRVETLQLDGEAKPDMGSLTLSSVNFNKVPVINAPDTIKKIANEMILRGVLAELEAFDAGMINYAKYLESKGLLKPPHYFNLLTGNVACAQSDLLHIGIMVRDLPPDSFWSLAGIGDSQLMVNSLAIASGGGVRVGLEDNIYYRRGELAQSNAQLVERTARIAKELQREIASPAEAREILGMK